MIVLEPYAEEHRAAWDAFVRKSKNGTFLFYRDYLEHIDLKVRPLSLLAWDEKRRLIALLPAMLEEHCLLSHGRLTYGGFVTDQTMKLGTMDVLFDALMRFCEESAIKQVVYRPVPYIYHRLPADEDLYVLFRLNARVISRRMLAAVRCDARVPFQERRMRGLKKAHRVGLEIQYEIDDWTEYWSLLTHVLHDTYQSQPVHSLDEMQLLKGRFPDSVKLFGVRYLGALVAGVVIYETERVARAQYIAADETGKRLGALDLLFETLLTSIYAHKAYFDFGTSERAGTHELNAGLIDQKEGFGARAIAMDAYLIDVPALVTKGSSA
jgi:hypothetical protein